LGGRGGGCSWGARPRAFLRTIPPISSRPGPQYGNPDHATQRSGKRRHLRQQETENLSGDLLLGSRRVPPVIHLHREAGGAQGARSVRIAQGTVNKLGGGALRGSARVRAALLYSCRPGPSPPCPKCFCVQVHAASRHPWRGVTIAPPPGGGSPDPSSTITPGGCRGSARRRQRRRPAARGARRGSARTTKTHHPTAPPRTPPRASRTRTASPHTGREDASLISPPSVNWPFPPARRGGAAN